jgi:hypothetical protein
LKKSASEKERKFKVGDLVVAKPYKSGYSAFYGAVVISYVREDGWVNIGENIMNYPSYNPSMLELEVIYNSPLYKALTEE